MHQVGVTNLGGGQLTPMVTTSESWLVAWSLGDKVYVSVKSAGLAIGHYSGVVAVGGAPGACTLDSPQAITVDLWVASGVSPDGVILQLPLVLR